MVKFEIICYQPIDKTINSGLEIKCLVYKMVSLLSYVIYNKKWDIKGFVGIFMIFDSLTKLLPDIFMIVLFITLLCVVLKF